MKRKPKPSIKSANRSLALFGIAVFMGVGLIALPIIVGVLLVVAYVPVGVAIFLPIAYMTRRRWQPKLTKYADRYLATPEHDRMQSRVGRTRGAPKPVTCPPKTDPTLELEFWNRRKGRYGTQEVHT
jgi:hypothetical protein